ncbi:hypothetical protein LCGC14_2266190, partial [marine sediment metagenome]
VEAAAGEGVLGLYLLDVSILDAIAPLVTAVTGLPADGEADSTSPGSFSVQFSEDLLAETLNRTNPYIRYHDGHWYKITSSSQTWAEAEAEAQALGGHLVTINDAAEQAFVQQWFANWSPWIGLTDQDVEATWAWSSGEDVTFTNWYSGEPNDGDYRADYALLSGDGEWYDDRSYRTHWGLIEFDEADYPDADGDGIPDAFDVLPAETLNAFDLREAGIDGLFDTTDDRIYRLVLPSAYTAGTAVSLNVYDGPLGAGHYRLTVSDTITDPVDNALDGDADGTPGGPYHQVFDILDREGYVFEGRFNGVWAQAAELELTEDPIDSGYLYALGYGSLSPTGSEDIDYWQVDLQEGDYVSVSVDTPTSGVNPWFEFYNPSFTRQFYDYDAGPGLDAYYSGWQVPSDGTYYFRVRNQDTRYQGDYEVRVDVGRGIQAETDNNYHNDSIANADTLAPTSVGGGERVATVSGLIMATVPGWPDYGNVDEDYFRWGTVNAGNVVELTVSVPSISTLRPKVRLIDSDGNDVADETADATDGHFLATISEDGQYYALVEAAAGEGVLGLYLLDVSILDAIAPLVTSVTGLPADGEADSTSPGS